MTNRVHSRLPPLDVFLSWGHTTPLGGGAEQVAGAEAVHVVPLANVAVAVTVSVLTSELL